MITTIIILLILKGIRLYHDYKDWYRKMERIKPQIVERHPLPEYVLMVRSAARIKNTFSIKLNLE
jgi:hypothetical protein